MVTKALFYYSNWCTQL